MDLTAVVEKLEEFGLQNFISAFGLPLCKKTVSPWLVALALKFNPDEIAIINHPPDDTSKCHKLYELIQKKCVDQVEDFIEALKATDNEHVITFIQTKLADPSSASQIPSSSSSFNIETGIWFNIPEPIDSFCGREDFLNELHEKLQSQHPLESAEAAVAGPSLPKRPKMTSITVLSQLKIVSGLAGIGKTETATQYIWSHRKSYNNFIWINAESESSMQNSFTKLAEELKVPVKDAEGKPREMDKIIKEIYNNISNAGKSNLMVFDNAEDYQSCKNFFPISLHPNLKKPVILVTSRNQEWKSATGKIQVLPLGVLTESESLEFLLTQLEVEDSPEFREETKEFIQLIGGLPLALQQAVAYIKNEKEDKEFLGQSYEIEDYVLEFKSSMKKFLSFCPHPDSSATVFVTWNVTFQRIQGLENGKAAVKILDLLSFLYADKIPLPFLHDIVAEIEDGEFSGALKLLKKYSLIKMNVKDVCLSIHRQLQFVILQYLDESKEIAKMAEDVSKNCSAVLKKIKISNEPECSDIFLNISQILSNPFKLLMPTNFWLLIWEFAPVLLNAGRYRESYMWYRRLHLVYQKLFGDDHRGTITALSKAASQLFLIGEYDKSLALQQEVLERMKTHPDFGADHPTTIVVKDQLSIDLRVHKKHFEALELLQEISAQKVKIHGENHPSTLQTQIEIADLYSELGDFPKSAALREELEKKTISHIHPDLSLSVQFKTHKAQELYDQGEFQEASRLFKEVHDAQKATLGENHPQTLNTLVLLTEALLGATPNNLPEALNQFKKVYESSERNSGKDHFRSVHIKLRIAYVLTEMGQYDESLKIIQEIGSPLPTTPGPNIELALLEQCKIAKRYCEQGQFSKGLELLEDAERKQTEILGSSHPHTLGARELKARLMSCQENSHP